MKKHDDIIRRTRNRHLPERYFSVNVRSGVTRSPTGVRVITLPEELILGLHQSLEDEAGSAAPVILYEVGKWWGRQFARHYVTELRSFYDVEPGDLPISFYLQVLRKVWAVHGWGQLQLSFDLRDRGFIEAQVDRAMYSDVVGSLGRTSNHLTAGILASLVGDIAGRDLECVEIASTSRGDQECRFLVGIKARTEIVESWVKQGRSPDEIVTAIQQDQLA
jgi:hypothetical protein